MKSSRSRTKQRTGVSALPSMQSGRATIPNSNPELVPELLGVTVSTPKYAELCGEAVARVERYLKIPVQVIECADEDAFKTKLKLDVLCPSTRCMFFDADWWAIREMDFSGWDGSAWMAVHDPGVFHPRAFPVHDCPVLGLAAELYFNSGLFLWDNRRKEHRYVFRTARNLEHDIFAGKREGLHDWGDQSLLNAGVQHNGVTLNLLPFSFNYMRYMLQGRSFLHTPAEVHAVHAAGFPVLEKMGHLRTAAEFLGYDLDVSEHGDMAEAAALKFQHGRVMKCA